MTAKIISFNRKVIEPKCSFCNKPKSAVVKQRLVENGHGQAICIDCLQKCKNLLNQTSE